VNWFHWKRNEALRCLDMSRDLDKIKNLTTTVGEREGWVYTVKRVDVSRIFLFFLGNCQDQNETRKTALPLSGGLETDKK